MVGPQGASKAVIEFSGELVVRLGRLEENEDDGEPASADRAG